MDFNLFEHFGSLDLPKEESTSEVVNTTNVEVEKTEEVENTTEEVVENTEKEEQSTEEVETIEEVEEVDEFSFSPVVEALAEAGVLSYDESKEYEDSEEGFAEVIKDTVQKEVKKEIESLGEEAVKVFEHIKKGGSLRDLIELEANKIDFSNIDLEDKDTQEALIIDHLSATGYSQEEIDEQLETLRDLGEEKLKKQAAVAQRYLAKEQEKRETEFHARVEQEKIDRENATKVEVTRIEESIFNSQEIAGFNLSQEEKQQFRDYLLKPDKTGKTQYQRDIENEKSALELALLKFKKVDAKFIDSSIETKKTIGLKKALSKYKDNNAEVKAKLPIEPVKETAKLPKTWYF